MFFENDKNMQKIFLEIIVRKNDYYIIFWQGKKVHVIHFSGNYLITKYPNLIYFEIKTDI